MDYGNEAVIVLPGALAQDKSIIYHEQITYDASGLHITPCPLPGCPTLSHWGILILEGLAVIIGIIVMRGRIKVAAPI